MVLYTVLYHEKNLVLMQAFYCRTKPMGFFITKRDSQYMCDVTLRRVLAKIIAVERQ